MPIIPTILKLIVFIINIIILRQTFKISFLALKHDSNVNLVNVKKQDKPTRKQIYIYLIGNIVIALFYSVIGFMAFGLVPLTLKTIFDIISLCIELLIMAFGVYLIRLYKRIYRYLIEI
ncbi:hypothetical protein DXC19_11665 [Staphylococcus warneri]|uniref:Uncharacterized protein n=1 Tax=Staphylococcus warneri TaxID=1292 RepID=A0A8B2ZI35_STAWA|nr:hypothetical protein DXC19_11665 [Staphylococcus warneri]